VKRALGLAIVVACIAAHPAVAQSSENTGPLEIQLALSKQTVLLGEPVWVDVAVTNHSKQKLAISWGVGCMAHEAPLKIEIPNATQGDGEPKYCGIISSDCLYGGPLALPPNATGRRRFMLEGNFRITKPGHYDVSVTKSVGWELWSGYKITIDNKFHRKAEMQTQIQTLSLDVLEPDPKQLLALEQALLAQVAEPYHKPTMTIPRNDDPKAYSRAVKEWSQAQREADFGHILWQDAVKDGLSAHPAVGMEPIFEAWVVPYGEWIRGLEALYHLNTPEARAALARFTAAPTTKPSDTDWMPGAIRFTATDDLSKMGDTSYLPLLEQLSTDENSEVRMNATRGLGTLGGESELPFLEARVRNGKTIQDFYDAFEAMANTASAKAVPLLIDAFTSSQSTNGPDSELMALTHHKLPPIGRKRTPQESQFAWRTWWTVHQGSAKIFGPDQCLDPFGDEYPE
jgi:hypothetical protein